VHLRLAVDIAQRTAGLRMRDFELGIDPNTAHLRTVDHKAAFHDGEPGDIVTAALHGHADARIARKVHTGDDVGGADAARNQRRAPVDHRVPDGAGFVVPGIVLADQGAAKRGAQRIHARRIDFE
jgi:hypothetical protein